MIITINNPDPIHRSLRSLELRGLLHRPVAARSHLAGRVALLEPQRIRAPGRGREGKMDPETPGKFMENHGKT